MMEQREYLRRKAAGEYLRDTYKFCSPSMLSKLAVIGGGPELQYVGAIPLYEKTKLDAWALSKMSPQHFRARRSAPQQRCRRGKGGLIC